ncbi:DUF2239 family protein [Brevundimonas sp. TWP2-3-4b1]|uniref:DUF2239 family protein n=1 Tax=Brevundimonas sp. TWP2-3-4b1 TaxID=2804580 RepID=UPI003CE97DA4
MDATTATDPLHNLTTGDLPGYEEATRRLFAGDATGFEVAVAGWPDGVRDHVQMLGGRTWENGLSETGATVAKPA